MIEVDSSVVEGVSHALAAQLAQHASWNSPTIDVLEETVPKSELSDLMRGGGQESENLLWEAIKEAEAILDSVDGLVEKIRLQMVLLTKGIQLAELLDTFTHRLWTHAGSDTRDLSGIQGINEEAKDLRLNTIEYVGARLVGVRGEDAICGGLVTVQQIDIRAYSYRANSFEASHKRLLWTVNIFGSGPTAIATMTDPMTLEVLLAKITLRVPAGRGVERCI